MSQTEDNMNKIFIFISWNSKRLLLSKTKKNLEHNKKITNLTIKIYLKNKDMHPSGYVGTTVYVINEL